MISATSLSSASSPHSLTKSAQIPLGLENGRLRVDSQKFLVPSLPVSARALNNDPSSKRRERSIVNGVAHPSESHHITSNHINGLRRSYSGSPLHQPQLHTSPRKDAQSPLYNGESSNNGCSGMPSNPSNFSVRSSVPIPCSSPSPASSASPNKSHSPSSIPSPNSANGSYTSQLPPGLPDLNLNSPAAAAAAAAAASRLYPGGFHGLASHPAAAHLSPYYAAAAAAASHSLPYPIFGAHSYNPHSASSYLDNFHHSNLLAVPQMRTSPSASPPRPPSSYMPSPNQHHSPQLQGPHTTSTTSLHNQLIESVGSGERYNGHNHNHLNNHLQHHPLSQHNGLPTNNCNNSRFSSSGGPVTKTCPSSLSNGMSVGIANIPSPGAGISQAKNPHHGSLDGSSDKSYLGSRCNKNWAEFPSKVTECVSHLMDNNEDMKVPHGKEGSLKHYILTRSPEDLTSAGGGGKMKQFTVTGTEPNCNSGLDSSAMLTNNHASYNNGNPFLPPSPKKRSGQWNFTTSNNVKTDLPPPSLPPPHSAMANSDSSKYLTKQTKNPSSNALTSNNSCNIIHSPKSPYLITPPSSTSAQNFHFQFPNLKSTSTASVSSSSSNHSPRNHNGNHSPASSTTLSAPSTPTMPTIFTYPGTGKMKSYGNASKANPPVRIEQLPTIDAFHRGSLTQLPNGDLKRVEDLSVEDFFTAAEFLSDSISIINCTVISIHLDTNNSLCKVILTMGSHNQQVIVETSAEQPFYVIGRGWSSSAPAKTEQRLQLRCTPLCVGDVCITLRRNVAPVMATSSATHVGMTAPKNTNVIKASSSTSKGSNYNSNVTPSSSPKSKLSGGGVPGPGGGKGSSTRLTSTASNTGTRANRRTTNASSNKGITTNGTANAMLPPPTPPPPSPVHTNHQQQHVKSQSGQPISLAIGKRASPPMPDENNHPSCPKKRRWSAPEAISDDNESAIKTMV
ncbi:unnamed protein product [Allacma fusca]|uniref:AXH domain-containing protein n=1 Tax=Allacma fusca TaxID=39272 RepID=A0A8J2NLH3_9HEXA|nr:unnamed protein product [Allacma fusca]